MAVVRLLWGLYVLSLLSGPWPPWAWISGGEAVREVLHFPPTESGKWVLSASTDPQVTWLQRQLQCHQEGAGYTGRPVGTNAGQAHTHLQRADSSAINFLTSGSCQWGSGHWLGLDQGSREPGGRQGWEALGPGAKQRTCAGCGEFSLVLGPSVGWGPENGTRGGGFLLLQDCLLCLTLHPSLPKREPGRKGQKEGHLLSAYCVPSTLEILSHSVLSTNQKV